MCVIVELTLVGDTQTTTSVNVTKASTEKVTLYFVS